MKIEIYSTEIYSRNVVSNSCNRSMKVVFA